MSQPDIRFKSDRIDAYLREHLAPDENVLWVCDKASTRLSNKLLHWFGLTMYLAVITIDLVLKFNSYEGLISFGYLSAPWLAAAGIFAVYGALSRYHFAYAITDDRIFVLNTFLFTVHRCIWPREIQLVAIQDAHKEKATIFLFYYSLFAWGFVHAIRDLIPHNKLSGIRNPNVPANLIRAHLLNKTTPARAELLSKPENCAGQTSKPPETEEEKAARQGLFRTWG